MTSAALPEIETPAPVLPLSRLRVTMDWPRLDYPPRLKKSAGARTNAVALARTLNPDCYSITLFASGAAYGAVTE